MNGTDIILGYFDKNSNGVIKDYYAEGQKVKEDTSQDIFDTGIVRKDGITNLKFKMFSKIENFCPIFSLCPTDKTLHCFKDFLEQHQLII